MAITQLPTPPSRADSVTFAARADAFMAALPQFQAEANALQITTNAQTAANEAASQAAAVAAGVARDAAVSAWAASTAPAEQLASISRSIHFGAVVKSIVYDTSKDSDGGAWRKRCADKSWYTEALGGDRWIGQQATIAAAWTAAGSATGAVFQATATAGPLTSGKYYAATSSTTATEVFRGISREFPAQVAIVAETARVVIYDLTQASCPMWMVFTAGSAYMARGSVLSVSAINGMMALGCGSAQSLALISFPSDSGYLVWITSQYTGPYLGGISQRNAALGFNTYGTKYAPIVNQNVNDVAITVLDTSPIDPATGLPVPTIAVATAGGVSVIRDTGAVVNIGTANVQYAVTLIGPVMFVSGVNTTNFGIWKCPDVTAASPVVTNYYGTFGTGVLPSFDLTDVNTGPKHIRTPKGMATARTVQLALLYENPADANKGLHAHISNAYNSGWLPGDIRGAYLADTVAETITASGELVTNGTFTTDTSGWTAASAYASTAAVVAGEMQVTATAAFGRQIQNITFVIGKTYRLQTTCRVVSGGGNATLSVTTTGGADVFFTLTASASNATLSLDFVATASTTSICVGASAAGAIAAFDNISVKLADPDRSVKNTGMVINGSLTKAAVATGAGLVAYSGFSATNYLEQPYSANLDFGTGDFCVMGWVNLTSFTAASSFLHRALSGSIGGLLLQASTTGALELYGTASSTYTLIVASAASTIPLNTNSLVAAIRVSGTVFLYVNGVQVATVANSTNLTYASALTRIGVRLDSTTYVFGSMALWRVSATAPSADQIAHIYRTELPLFQTGAQCTIAGTSTAVTALAYDDVADTLHVGTSWGRSGFRDLLRVDSEATTTGAITSLSANEGVVITGGASSAKAYAPAVYLRDELRRKDVARKALGRIPAFFDYTATASQTAFVAPKGFTIKALYKNGTLMRETTTGVYWTRSNDGFQETATLSVGASVSDWISLMCVRT